MNDPSPRALHHSSLILLSGGLDSATLLAQQRDAITLALSVHYGQRHARELSAAADVAAYYGVRRLQLDFSGLGDLLPGSSLTDLSVPTPHGHYTHKSMARTIVANRNAVLLMAAVGIADAHGLSTVLIAVHAGDHAIYPDCRPEFIAAANQTAQLATAARVSINAPFAGVTKAEIVRRATQLRVPVAITWSCYEGGTKHCGRCGTCVERREAFAEAGVPEGIEYADQ